MNHVYNEVADKTLCGEYGGRLAESISCNERPSCPECIEAAPPTAETARHGLRCMVAPCLDCQAEIAQSPGREQGRLVTMLPTLTEFLLARIAEDEEKASSERRMCERITPERLRAECEVKRRIVNECDGFDEQGQTVRQLLATVYADHPDYRSVWRP